MTQKELLYIEDIYNHENTIIKVIEDALKRLKTREFDDILSNQLKVHNNHIKKIKKLLSGEANG